MNTTDKATKKKSAIKMHLVQGQGPFLNNLESCEMSHITQLNPWQTNNLAAHSFIHSSHSYLPGFQGLKQYQQQHPQSDFHTTILSEPQVIYKSSSTKHFGNRRASSLDITNSSQRLVGSHQQNKMAQLILQKVITQSILKVQRAANKMNLRQTFCIIKQFSDDRLKYS